MPDRLAEIRRLRASRGTTNIQIDAKVVLDRATGLGEGKARLKGKVHVAASGTYNEESYDVEVEWGHLGPVVTKVYRGGSLTAWAVGAACHRSGPIQDTLEAVLGNMRE